MKRLGAKVILRCQNMFYNSGEVLGIFFPLGGGGSPIPKSICQNGYQKVNILMKTKNAPKDLKCKINHTFFFGNRGSPKGGGGGVRHLGKIPQTSRLGGVLYHCYVILIVMPIVMMVVPDHDDPLSTTTKPWIIRGKLPKREREV